MNSVENKAIPFEKFNICDGPNGGQNPCHIAKQDSGAPHRKHVCIPSFVPTILCGGVGSRLWPISRDFHPKPFIRLSDGQSLLQKAFLRASRLPNVAEILIITNRELYFKTADEFRRLNVSDLQPCYVLEPSGRNTAPAIATAAQIVKKRHGDDAVMLILAADHLIANDEAFGAAVSKATQLATAGKLVTFGIKPDQPETGYGYLETQGDKVLRFIEKPSLERAREYIDSGQYLWNSGMFCFTANAVLDEMRRHCPEILAATHACMEQSKFTEGQEGFQLELDAPSFATVPSNSIDYALMERTNDLAVVPCDIGWSDIGSWSVLGDLDESDGAGNRIQGEVLVHGARNCTIQSHAHLIGAVGVKNLVIIDTPDAILVADKASAQDVKHIYAKLKEKGHDAYKIHRTSHRPWGTYTVLEEGERFKIKRIEVNPGSSLSLQMHHHRSEHWIVVSGMAKVTNGEREFFVSTNESTYIPAGHRHRLENPGIVALVMIEVQSGEYLGEDDIVRFDDKYGRI